MLQIGELARLAGVTPRAIRHYHHIGLLPEPARTANGYCTYGANALSRLVQIRRLGALGLGLPEISDALDDESARRRGADDPGRGHRAPDAPGPARLRHGARPARRQEFHNATRRGRAARRGR